MGDITLVEIRDEIKLSMEDRSDAGVSTANLNRWINRVYRIMTHPSVHEFDEMKASHDIVLVQDQWIYPLTETVLGYKNIGIRAMFYYESAAPTFSDIATKLDPRNVRWFSDRQHTNGPPRRYVTGEGENLWIDPVPGSAENGNILRVHLWKQVERLSDDTDTTLLPAYFDEAIVLGSQGMAEFRLGYRDRSRETLALYNGIMNNASQKSEIEAEDWDFKPNMRAEGFMRVS